MVESQTEAAAAAAIMCSALQKCIKQLLALQAHYDSLLSLTTSKWNGMKKDLSAAEGQANTRRIEHERLVADLNQQLAKMKAVPNAKNSTSSTAVWRSEQAYRMSLLDVSATHQAFIAIAVSILRREQAVEQRRIAVTHTIISKVCGGQQREWGSMAHSPPLRRALLALQAMPTICRSVRRPRGPRAEGRGDRRQVAASQSHEWKEQQKRFEGDGLGKPLVLDVADIYDNNHEHYLPLPHPPALEAEVVAGRRVAMPPSQLLAKALRVQQQDRLGRWAWRLLLLSKDGYLYCFGNTDTSSTSSPSSPSSPSSDPNESASSRERAKLFQPNISPSELAVRTALAAAEAHPRDARWGVLHEHAQLNLGKILPADPTRSALNREEVPYIAFKLAVQLPGVLRKLTMQSSWSATFRGPSHDVQQLASLLRH